MGPRNSFTASRRSHQILDWLKRGKEVKIEDVVDEFDIQYPQARADLKFLEEIYELPTHRDGRKKVWSWPGLDSDHIDVATVSALELGAVSLDIFRGTQYGEDIERLKDYCRERVPENHQPRLEQLSDAVHMRRTWLPTDPDAILEHIESSLDALFVNKAQWLVGTYERSDGRVGDYLLYPRRLVWYHGRLWLLALDDDALKLFDVAGFESLERYRAAEHGVELIERDREEGGEDVRPHPAELSEEKLQNYLAGFDDEPEAYFEDAFGIYAGNYPVESIHLEVRGRWQNYLSRYRLHQTQRNEPDEDSLHVYFEMAVCPEFRSFVLGMIPDVQVHAPEGLRDDLHNRVRDWLAFGGQ